MTLREERRGAEERGREREKKRGVGRHEKRREQKEHSIAVVV